ncbi:transposase-like protein [Bradyrhizobium sp. USDA 4369]
MKASKFSEAQIAFVLKQAEDGTAVAEVCRKAGISQATYFNWKKKYAGLMPSEMKRLRQLEEENAKLKRIVADLSLPSKVSFSFDREERTESDIDDLKRQSNGRAHFLPRLTYENYLLDPDAILALLEELSEKHDRDVPSRAQIDSWLKDNYKKFKPNMFSSGEWSNRHWLKNVHAPSVLKCILEDLAGPGDRLDKPNHSRFLTEWLITNKPDSLQELSEYVNQLIESTS